MALLLVEFEAADRDGNVSTWRAATEGYNHSTAPGFYPEAIEETVGIRREIRGAESRRRAVGTDFDDLVLINADGRFDELIDYGVDGREIRGFLVEGPMSAYDERLPLFTATMGPASFSLETITIPIQDRLSELERPYSEDSYDGEGDLGGSQHTQGRPKPKPEGEVYNVELYLVNSEKGIYQFTAGTDADVADVFIGGVPLVRYDPDYESEEELLDNDEAPPADMAYYRCWPRSDGEGGYIRLPWDSDEGEPREPSSTLTANIITSDDNRIGSVLKRLALRALDEDDIEQGDIDALNDEFGEPVGVHQDSERELYRAMERVCQGAGLWFGFDRFGLLRFGKWEKPEAGGPRFVQANPTSQPLAEGDYDIEEFESEDTEEEDLPAYSVAIFWGRNYTVQDHLDKEILEEQGVDNPGDRLDFISSEWSEHREKDESVKDKHKNAKELEIESAWATRYAAKDAAERILAREKTRAVRAVVSTWMTPGIIEEIEIADSVEVQLPRYGMDDGRAFRIRWIDLDPVENRIELGVWG